MSKSQSSVKKGALRRKVLRVKGEEQVVRLAKLRRQSLAGLQVLKKLENKI